MSTATESSTEDSGKAQLEREITMIEQAPYEDRGEQVSRLLLRRLLVALFTFISRWFAMQLTGRRFDSRPFHFQVTTVGKLFTHMCLCYQVV